MLFEEGSGTSPGLALFELAYNLQTMRLALALDGGLVFLYELDSFEKVGQIKVQTPDVTSIIYVNTTTLVVGQV